MNTVPKLETRGRLVRYLQLQRSVSLRVRSAADEQRRAYSPGMFGKAISATSGFHARGIRPASPRNSQAT